jgi:hypothetical protein
MSALLIACAVSGYYAAPMGHCYYDSIPSMEQCREEIPRMIIRMVDAGQVVRYIRCAPVDAPASTASVRREEK